MPEQKGFKQMLMRIPTRILCLLLLVMVAMIAINALQYSPVVSTENPEDLFVFNATTGLYEINWDGYTSDLFTVDAVTGASVMDMMKVGAIAGGLIGALVLAWLIGFLPKKLPLWVFPVIGGVVAFMFVYGLQLKPTGESAAMIEWVEEMIIGTGVPDKEGLGYTVYPFWNSEAYREMMYNTPFDAGYMLFLYPVLYVGALLLGYDEAGNWAAFSNLVWLQLVNVVLLAVAVYMLLRAANRLFGKNAAQIAGLLSVAFLPLAIATVALTAEIPALFFASIAIERGVAYMKNEKKLEDGSVVRFKKNGTILGGLLVALCMALAMVLKASYVVVGLALAIALLIDLIRNNRWKSLIPFAIIIALVAMTFIGMYPGQLAVNAMNSVFGLPAAPAPAGTAIDVTGQYVASSTPLDVQTGMTNNSTSILNALMTGDTSVLYNKLMPQWIDPSMGTAGGVINHLLNDGLYVAVDYIGPLPLYLFYSGQINADGSVSTLLDANLLLTVSNAVMNIIYVFAIIGLLVCVFRANVERLLMPLIAFGGILFHLLFGANPISGIPYMLALIVMAGYGLAFVAGFLQGKKRRNDPMGKPYKKKKSGKARA